tara:strand:- start:5725 stop:6234 length:510 start_codon:yes stop_codon:yes gene_type:complete
MELLNEKWLPILGYEGRYEVSSHGRIRSLPRYRRGKSGALVPVAGRIMVLSVKKPKNNGRTLPYVEVKLRDGSPRNVVCKSYLVHRLVAQAFVGELFEGCHVNHIDGNHTNNYFTNLQILSAKEHGLLHPCISNPERNANMQKAAQAKLRAMRKAGEIIGRIKVKAEQC